MLEMWDRAVVEKWNDMRLREWKECAEGQWNKDAESTENALGVTLAFTALGYRGTGRGISLKRKL